MPLQGMSKHPQARESKLSNSGKCKRRDITFHIHFPAVIQIWHRWLVNDCHCQEPANDCCYQKPTGLWKNQFSSQSGCWYHKGGGGWQSSGTTGASLTVTRPLQGVVKPLQPLSKPTSGTLQSTRQRGFTPGSAAHLPWALSHFHLSQHPPSSTVWDTYFPHLSFLPGWFRLPVSG